jgi:hypothetical protein
VTTFPFHNVKPKELVLPNYITAKRWATSIDIHKAVQRRLGHNRRQEALAQINLNHSDIPSLGYCFEDLVIDCNTNYNGLARLS